MKQKKSLAILLTCVLFMMNSYGQQIAINEDGSLPSTGAILDIKSTNKGILIPRMSSAEREAIIPAKGLLVYDTTINFFCYHTGTTWRSLATAYSGGYAWSLTGNTSSDSNFLGTINNIPLKIKVNNLPSGLISPLNGHTFWGYNSGGLGQNVQNIFSNTGIGTYSLYKTDAGSFNTALGAHTLYENKIGSENTAIGLQSLGRNTNGNKNTATGSYSLFQNSLGSENTANGWEALYNSSGGSFNTAIGAKAGRSNGQGNYNTALGYFSHRAHSPGDNNTCIGSYSSALSGTGTFNSSSLGYDAIANTSNKIRLGNSAVTSVEGPVPFSTPSDGRFKYSVKEDVRGLDFIMQLRPVTYNFDVSGFDAHTRRRLPDSLAAPANNLIKAAYSEAASIRRSGFIAQEVEKAAAISGYSFSGLTKPKTEEEHYSLSYESFVVPMVKAMQEQQQLILAQSREIKQLQEELMILQQQVQIVSLAEKK